MATKTYGFFIDTNGVEVFGQIAQEAGQANEKFKSLKQELRALHNAMLEMDTASAEFQKASQRASQLKDQIGDLAQEVNANAGGAFETASNNVALFQSRLLSLDFAGAGQALTNLATNIRAINFATLTQELGGFIKGIIDMGKSLLMNPLFLIPALITGIVIYWKELTNLWNSGKIATLEKAKATLEAQAKTLERQIALEKKLEGATADTYEKEVDLLYKRIKSAETEVRLAQLKRDTEARTEAISKKEEAIHQLKLLQAEKQNEINTALLDARKLIDPTFELEQKKLDASKKYREAQQEIIKQEEAKIQLQRASEKFVGNINSKLTNQTNQLQNQSNVQRGNGSMLMMQNQQEEKKHLTFQRQLSVQEQALENRKKDLALLDEAIKKSEEGVKSEESEQEKQARREEYRRKAEEKRNKRLEDAKKLEEEIKEIEERIAEINRSGMSQQEKELFELEKKQKIERDTYDKAKKSEAEKQQLRLAHEKEYQEILDKYDKEEEEKERAKQEALRKLNQEALIAKQQQLIELQSSIDEADEANYQATLSQQQREILAVQDKYFEQIELAKANNLDITALEEAKNRELGVINDKYRKEEEQKQIALNQKRVQLAGDVFGALSTLASSFSAKSEQDAKKQFEVVKAFNLAQAIVATYTAVNNALTAGGNPAKLATGAQFVEAGIALATGLANVIKISQTKFESKTTPSPTGGLNGSSGGGNSPSPLSLSFLANQPNQQPPFQAYVISGQVSNSIEAQQLINNQSKL